MKIINSSLFILGIAYPFIIYFFSKSLWIFFLFPVIIYIIFFAVFMYKINEKPLIQSFAELEHKIRNLAPLTNKEKRYTHILTYIWAYFFLISALICIFLSLLENKKYWFFYTGVAGYLLTGMLFISERILRSKLIKIIK